MIEPLLKRLLVLVCAIRSICHRSVRIPGPSIRPASFESEIHASLIAQLLGLFDLDVQRTAAGNLLIVAGDKVVLTTTLD